MPPGVVGQGRQVAEVDERPARVLLTEDPRVDRLVESPLVSLVTTTAGRITGVFAGRLGKGDGWEKDEENQKEKQRGSESSNSIRSVRWFHLNRTWLASHWDGGKRTAGHLYSKTSLSVNLFLSSLSKFFLPRCHSFVDRENREWVLRRFVSPEKQRIARVGNHHWEADRR